jgi:hypothetical protein
MYTAVNYGTRAGSKKVEVEVWVLGPAHDTTLLRQGKHQHHQAKALTASALHCHRGRLFGIICWPLTCHISRAAKVPCCFASRVSRQLHCALCWGRGPPGHWSSRTTTTGRDHGHQPHGTVAQCRSNWITACATGRGRKRQSNGSSSWGIRREGGQLRCFPSQGSISTISTWPGCFARRWRGGCCLLASSSQYRALSAFLHLICAGKMPDRGSPAAASRSRSCWFPCQGTSPEEIEEGKAARRSPTHISKEGGGNRSSRAVAQEDAGREGPERLRYRPYYN